jgi:ClpP class serine protease
MRKGHPISVVDDDKGVRESLADLLQSAGLEVATFASAEDFLGSWHLRTAACVILDLQMPGMGPRAPYSERCALPSAHSASTEEAGSRARSAEEAEAMSGENRSYTRTLANLARTIFWVGLLVIVVQQARGGPGHLDDQRTSVLDRFQQQRKSRAIAMIHREETVSLFGVPVSRYIDIDDSEAVLRAIRLTPPDQPIDLILHTPGGLVLAAEQIAHALAEHKGKVTVFVPHYAMSGGTLIALTADEVVMDPNAVLGPVDPQIGDLPAASLVKLLDLKPRAKISDEMLVLADVAAKSRIQVASFVAEVLLKHMPVEKARALAVTLSEGRWTHDFPITVEGARALGLPVSTDMPEVLYQLMDLYPQASAQRPSVLYVPLRRPAVPSAPPAGATPDRATK